jgi:4'-phosphopantetheinyl transferase
MKAAMVSCKWIEPLVGGLPQFKLSSQFFPIYCIRIADFKTRLELLNACLDANEIKRAIGYKQEKDRQRFIVSRAMLRIILAKYLDKQPATVEFYTDENKKPHVKNTGTDLHFNISHTDDFVVITVDNTPVGIDLEKINGTFVFENILEKIFTADEIKAIQDNDDHSRHMFYRLWTRKEALLKASGKGIDNDIPHIPSLDGVHHTSISQGGIWDVHTFGLQDTYLCSVAFQRLAGNREVCLYWLDTFYIDKYEL